MTIKTAERYLNFLRDHIGETPGFGPSCCTMPRPDAMNNDYAMAFACCRARSAPAVTASITSEPKL